jgi:hypothetical protein
MAGVTAKGMPLVAEPVGAVMAIGPVVAPDGTEATICGAAAEITVAGTPLNVTSFWSAVALNPVPCIVTDVPTGALFGITSMIETMDELCRSIERRLPTASYE